jgi:hypothetical protein
MSCSSPRIELPEPEVSQDREYHDHDADDVKDTRHALPPFRLLPL